MGVLFISLIGLGKEYALLLASRGAKVVGKWVGHIHVYCSAAQCTCVYMSHGKKEDLVCCISSLSFLTPVSNFIS